MTELNYAHLRYFRAVAREGNLTRAAGRLNVSQSALSVQIRTLEARLGHALFERRGRRLHLTEAGRIALDHAEAIFRTGDELLGALRDTGRTRRALRVGALATLSRNFQIAFLRPALGRPDVEVILRSGSAAELLRALQSLDLDVVLTNRAPASDALTPFVCHRLAEQHVSLIGLPERINDHAMLAELLEQHPVILPTRDDSVRTGFDALVARLGIRPQIVAEVDDMAMMRLLVRENIGLAVLPPIVVKDELTIGLLKEAARLPDVFEIFYAVTLDRKFPNAIVNSLLRTDTLATGNIGS